MHKNVCKTYMRKKMTDDEKRTAEAYSYKKLFRIITLKP